MQPRFCWQRSKLRLSETVHLMLVLQSRGDLGFLMQKVQGMRVLLEPPPWASSMDREPEQPGIGALGASLGRFRVLRLFLVIRLTLGASVSPHSVLSAHGMFSIQVSASNSKYLVTHPEALVRKSHCHSRFLRDTDRV